MGTAASSQTDSIDITNKFVSVERGARDLFVHPRASCGFCAFLVLTSSPQPPLRRVLALGLVQVWLLIFAEKIHRQVRRAVRTRGDDFLFATGDLRDVS